MSWMGGIGGVLLALSKETPTSTELKRSKVQGLLHHLEDGTRWLANPMFWFIMAPYLSPPNWGVAIAIYGLTTV